MSETYEKIKAYRELVNPLREKFEENFEEMNRLREWGGMSGPIAKLIKRNEELLAEIASIRKNAGF